MRHGTPASVSPSRNSIFVHGLGYLRSRIDGVKVIPTNNRSGERKRLTVWPTVLSCS